jgi:hypothetical protein
MLISILENRRPVSAGHCTSAPCQSSLALRAKDRPKPNPDVSRQRHHHPGPINIVLLKQSGHFGRKRLPGSCAIASLFPPISSGSGAPAGIPGSLWRRYRWEVNGKRKQRLPCVLETYRSREVEKRSPLGRLDFHDNQKRGGHKSCHQRHQDHHGVKGRRQDTQVKPGIQDHQFHQSAGIHQHSQTQGVLPG